MPDNPLAGSHPAGRSPARTLSILATLFFAWGFITVINGTLLPHLRSVFELDYTRTTLLESVFFIAYFVASLPAAWLIERIGYSRAIITGLLVMAAGAFVMVEAARIPSYTVTLLALFVIASGIALLQVAANPYVAVIGPPHTASARLNLVQAFNSLGTTLAPLFGGYLILGRSASGTARGEQVFSLAQRMADARAVELPYALVGAVLIALAAFIWRADLPALGAATQRAAIEQRGRFAIWRHRNFAFGVPAIFIYVIAENGVANLFISFASAPRIGDLSHAQAARVLFLLWGGMMIGRFVGSALMRAVPAETALASVSIAGCVIMLLAATLHGPAAMWVLVLIGLCHAIMFPTIFTLAIRGLGTLTEEGSGLLVMAIAGGALVIVQGWLADRFGLQHSFFLTAACELYILFFALFGCRTADLTS